MACLADYKTVKILEETESTKCFIAERGGQTYLLNAFRDRESIGEYLPYLAAISNESAVGPVEWFSENSALYAVFKYEKGVPLLKYLEKEALTYKYRLLILKNIAYKLNELSAEPPPLQKAVIEPENIAVSEGALLFNYKLPALLEYSERNSVYQGVAELTNSIFPGGEFIKSKGLKIILDKCDNSVYLSFAELAKDIDGLLKREEKELDLKNAVLDKHKNRLRAAKSILAAACVLIAAGFLYYEYALKSREGVPVFAQLTEIGSVIVDSPAVYEEETGSRNETAFVYVYGREAADIPVLEPLTETVSGAPPAEAPEPEAKPEKAPEYEVYIARRGDNLTKICLRHYGSADMVYRLAEYNHLDSPDIIIAGQELKLPPIEALVAPDRGTP